MYNKKALRAHIRAERDRFFATGPAAIEPPFQYRALLKHNLTIAVYSPIGSEADPSLLTHAATEAGCTIALPHVTTRDQPMRFLAWHPDAATVDGPFSLQQPPPTPQRSSPTSS